MATQIARIGSSITVEIPEELLRQANLAEGDPVEWTLTQSGTLALRAPRGAQVSAVEGGYEEWARREIEAGLVEAEGGETVPHERVVEWLRSWGTEHELPPPLCESDTPSGPSVRSNLLIPTSRKTVPRLPRELQPPSWTGLDRGRRGFLPGLKPVDSVGVLRGLPPVLTDNHSGEFGPTAASTESGVKNGIETHSDLAFEHIAEREAGFEACDSREAGKLFLVKAAIIVDAGYADDEHVVVLAGHQVAACYLIGPAHGRLEGRKHGRRLAFQRDADEDGHALAQQAVVDLGAITADDAGVFQRLDAPGSGRSRKPHRVANLVVRSAAMAIKVAHDGLVELV